MKKIIPFTAIVLSVFVTGCHTMGQYNLKNTTAFVVILALFILCWLLGKYTNMLRDEIGDCDEFERNFTKDQLLTKFPLLNKTNPFSLAKVQFALWTVVIASVYLYLALCKGDCYDEGINKTALVLMGIGAGVVTANVIVDKNEIQNQVTRHQDRPSRGFFFDILSDDHGISIHRFQSMVWTVIAVTVYISKVLAVNTGCVLPELSDTLLALTGISGATYIALRTKENNTPATGPTSTTAPTPNANAS